MTRESASVALITDLRREVREEIRIAALLDVPRSYHSPPPHDLALERDVVSALLCAPVPLDAASQSPLDALEPDDLFSPLHRCVAAMALELRAVHHEPTPMRVAAALGLLGYSGPDLVEEICLLRDGVPAIVHPGRHIDRVHALAERRRALDAAERLAAQLRDPATPAADIHAAVAALAAHIPPESLP
jgi:replicative DNA helicase